MALFVRIFLLALTLLLVPFAPPAFEFGQAVAQEAAKETEIEAVKSEFADWNKIALRAETAVAVERASNVAFEELRAEIVVWRSRFVDAKDANSTRIDTIRNQILAIGPQASDGTIELAEITERRNYLNEQLGVLEAPARAAAEAHSRADGIIREIDTIIRDRLKNRLMVLGPSPLNPAYWFEAFKDFQLSFELAADELRTTWLVKIQQQSLRHNLPATFFFLALALVLLLRSRYWVERLTLRLQLKMGHAYRRLVEFVVSTGQVILPVIGILALSEALFSTGLVGLRGQINVQSFPTIAMFFFSARWLAIRLFPLSDNRETILKIPDKQAAQMRWSAPVLGLLYGLHVLIRNVADFDVYSDATLAVLQFLPMLFSGFLLFRIGKILVDCKIVSLYADGADVRFVNRAMNIVGRFAMFVGVVGPLLSAVGYHLAAVSLIYPTVASVGLIAVMSLFASVLRDIYALLTKVDEQSAQMALMPVLLNFCMFILSLPIFALIWGARVSDLTELWTKAGEGFAIGDTRVSPTQFITFAIIFVMGYVATRLIQSTLKGSVLPKTKLDPGAQVAIVSGLGYLGIFLAALVAISSAGINLSSLAIVAGALSVGIGFGLQTIVSNFVSGIILLIERPISEGDWIKVGDNMGIVRDISVRSTRIETFDKTDVIVPNSDLISGTVTNYTRGNVTGRAIVPVGVAYGTDTRMVEKLLMDIATAHPMVLLQPGPSVHFVGFGADSLDFEIRAILRDVNFGLSVKTEMRHQIIEKFAEENIEIPFAQRDVWLRNPETLHPKVPVPSGRKSKGKAG